MFLCSAPQEDERRSERSHRPEVETFEEGSDEGEYTDADDFIVDDDGRPIAEKRKKKKPIFSDAYVYTLKLLPLVRQHVLQLVRDFLFIIVR